MGGYLKFRHRPDTDTALKNGEEGERDVSISDEVWQVLEDYRNDRRVDQQDSFGRNPLLTTTHGRLSKSTIRTYIYAWTRPCAIGEGCPYDRDPNECKAAQRNNWAYECPDSLSCHPIRKGYIMAKLNTGLSKSVISERCDVSEDVLDKHYDHRSKKEQMEVRRDLIRQLHEIQSQYDV
jgi:integrase